MLMRPNKQQQRESRLRQHALTQGLRVHMLPLPASAAEISKQRSSSCATYCLPWTEQNRDVEPWLLLRGSYAHEINFSGCWQWVGKMQADPVWFSLLKSLIEELPNSVLAVGNGPQGLCVYWSEKGQEADVDRFAVLLKRLRDQRFNVPSA